MINEWEERFNNLIGCIELSINTQFDSTPIKRFIEENFIPKSTEPARSEVEPEVMPKIADRWQSNLPDPLNDQQHYDIILVTGEQINDVEYWAFGGGFKPNNKPNENYVDYPESTVEFYRIHID